MAARLAVAAHATPITNRRTRRLNPAPHSVSTTSHLLLWPSCCISHRISHWSPVFSHSQHPFIPDLEECRRPDCQPSHGGPIGTQDVRSWKDGFSQPSSQAAGGCRGDVVRALAGRRCARRHGDFGLFSMGRGWHAALGPVRHVVRSLSPCHPIASTHPPQRPPQRPISSRPGPVPCRAPPPCTTHVAPRPRPVVPWPHHIAQSILASTSLCYVQIPQCMPSRPCPRRPALSLLKLAWSRISDDQAKTSLAPSTSNTPLPLGYRRLSDLRPKFNANTHGPHHDNTSFLGTIDAARMLAVGPNQISGNGISPHRHLQTSSQKHPIPYPSGL